MKSGAADSPFDNGTDTENTDDTDAEDLDGQVTASTVDTESISASREQYPLKLRRDGVKDEREMVQFFLQNATEREENHAQSDVEDLLDEDVYLTDFREAAYLAGLRDPEATAEILREWGYDLD